MVVPGLNKPEKRWWILWTGYRMERFSGSKKHPELWTNELGKWPMEKDTAGINGQEDLCTIPAEGSRYECLDSFTTPRAMIFIYRKPSWIRTGGLRDPPIYDIIITLNKNLKTPDSLGYITSPLYGRGKTWRQLKWAVPMRQRIPHPWMWLVYG